MEMLVRDSCGEVRGAGARLLGPRAVLLIEVVEAVATVADTLVGIALVAGALTLLERVETAEFAVAIWGGAFISVKGSLLGSSVSCRGDRRFLDVSDFLCPLAAEDVPAVTVAAVEFADE